MAIFLVSEVDGTAFQGYSERRGYIQADTKEQAEELVGKPSNSWNSYAVVELEPFQPDKESE